MLWHSVARVMPRVGTSGCWGESKTLAWGFGMALHRLRPLVVFAFQTKHVLRLFVNNNIDTSLLICSMYFNLTGI